MWSDGLIVQVIRIWAIIIYLYRKNVVLVVGCLVGDHFTVKGFLALRDNVYECVL
jgi:hypothetical protein